jgi:hypothetical protein
MIKSAERVIAANSKAAMQRHPFTLSGICPDYPASLELCSYSIKIGKNQ